MCAEVEIHLIADSVSSEQVEDAIRSGIQLPLDTKEAKKYAATYFQTLLNCFHSGNNDSISREVSQSWDEVLRCLEETSRKVVAVSDEDDIIFSLYCPTRASLRELQDDDWTNELTRELDEILKLLGTSVFDFFSKLAEFTAHCQLANDWTCFARHNL